MVGSEALLQIAVYQVQGVLGVVTFVEDMLDFVGGVPFGGNPSGVSNGLAELRGAEQLAVLGSCGGGDAFVDEAAPQVVDPRSQQHLRESDTLLDPGDLEIGNPVVEHDARYGVDLEHLRAGGSAANPVDGLLEVHRGLGVDEAQGHKLGDAAAGLLDVANEGYMASLVLVGLHVAVHDGGGGGDS